MSAGTIISNMGVQLRRTGTFMTKPNYAICRIKKLHTVRDVEVAAGHNDRSLPTARTRLGARPPVELLQGIGGVPDRARRLLDSLGCKPRKNQVVAAEILLTASPEFFQDQDRAAFKEWLRSSTAFLRDEYGAGLISISAHTDESTPHLQAIVVPVITDIVRPTNKASTDATKARRAANAANAQPVRKLSYRQVFGGNRMELADLQTRYHSSVRHLGLERWKDTVGQGIRHNPLKQRAKELDQKALSLDAFEQDLLAFKAELAEQSEQLDVKRNEVWREEAAAKKVSESNAVEAARHVAERRALEQERAAYAREVAAFDIKKNDLANRELAIAAKDQRHRLDQEALDNKQVEIAEREDHAKRRQADIEMRETQLKLIAAIADGKIRFFRTRAQQRPLIDKSNLSVKEQAAADQAWPNWLLHVATKVARVKQFRKLAVLKLGRLRVREALATLAEKQNIRRAAKLDERDREIVTKNNQAIVNQMKAQEAKDAARALTSKAHVLISDANSKMAAAQQLKSSLSRVQAEVDAASVTVRHANLQIKAAKNVLSEEQRKLRDASRSRIDAEEQLSTTIAEKAAAKKEVDQLKAEVSGLRLEQEQQAEQVARLHAQKARLAIDMTELRDEQAALIEREAAIERKVANVAVMEKLADARGAQNEQTGQRHAFATAVLDELLTGKSEVELAPDVVSVKPGSKSQLTVSGSLPRAQFPDWFFKTYERLELMVTAEDKVLALHVALEQSAKEVELLRPEKAAEVDAQRRHVNAARAAAFGAQGMG